MFIGKVLVWLFKGFFYDYFVLFCLIDGEYVFFFVDGSDLEVDWGFICFGSGVVSFFGIEVG